MKRRRARDGGERHVIADKSDVLAALKVAMAGANEAWESLEDVFYYDNDADEDQIRSAQHQIDQAVNKLTAARKNASSL